MGWDYNRVGENGRLYSYYGRSQEWTYTERGREHTLKVAFVSAQSNGVQYYLISIDGKLSSERISAARLHYVLNQKGAQEVSSGTSIPLPLLIEEVEEYFDNNEWTDCPICGGCGIEYGKICHCAERLSYEIKNYNAERRLAKLMKS